MQKITTKWCRFVNVFEIALVVIGRSQVVKRYLFGNARDKSSVCELTRAEVTYIDADIQIDICIDNTLLGLVERKISYSATSKASKNDKADAELLKVDSIDMIVVPQKN